MSVSSLRVKYSRPVVEVVEIDVDMCTRTFGVAPCMATAAAGKKCFNTRATCKDPDHYAVTSKTLRFISPTPVLPAGVTAYPFLRSINTAPTVLDLNKISRRAQITVVLQDSVHHDRGIDPYYAERLYNPEAQGTFFSKLFRRNPYLVNRVLRIKTGYIDPSGIDTTFSGDFETRTYLIDHVEGPDSDGEVRIVAKDVLKLAEDRKSKIPVVTDGALYDPLGAGTTVIKLQSGQIAQYPTSGLLRVDDEFIAYTGKSGDTFTGVTRAQRGSGAATHGSNSKVQLCKTYDNQTPSDIIYDILVNYAGINPAFIPKTDWDNEVLTWLSSYQLTNVLSEPTGVQNVIESILEQTSSYLWWDERTQTIKFKTTAPLIPGGSPLFVVNDDNLLNNTFSIVIRDKDRISRSTIYYNIRSYTESRDKPENFTAAHVRVDTDAEDAFEYGESLEKVIYADWINASGPPIEMSGRLLRIFRDAPAEIVFQLDTKDGDKLWTGDVFVLNTRLYTDEYGAPRPTRFLITKARERKTGAVFEYTAMSFDLLAQLGLIGADTLTDYTVESDYNKSRYAFISKDDGTMSNGDKGYTIA